MKKLIIIAFAIGCSAFLFKNVSAQVAHEVEIINPDITPYHQAQDEINGINGLRFNTQKGWLNFVNEHANWGAKFDTYSGMPSKAAGPAFTISGNTLLEKAKHLLTQELKDYNIPFNELIVARNSTKSTTKYQHVNYKQVHGNYEVLFSNVQVRFSKDNKVVSFAVKAFSNIPQLMATLTEEDAKQYAAKSLNTTILNSWIDKSLYILPVPKDEKMDYKLVYKVTTQTQDTKEMEGKYVSYVDASSGEILYRQNMVKHITATAKGYMLPSNVWSPAVQVTLPHIQFVTSNNTTYFADSLGNFNFPGTTAVNGKLNLRGKWCDVEDFTGNVTPSLNNLTINNGDVIDFDSVNAAGVNKTNMYYHVTKVHDFMKSKTDPTFNDLDYPLPTIVDRTDGDCNAFYNGSSINFYASGNGCNATASIGDVAYHEYGHGINYDYYSHFNSPFDNGALGEGYADVWAFSITQSPKIGPGFGFNSPGSVIRRYDVNPKVYPDNIVGEVHADGEIIAGAWYDTYLNWGSFADASQLFADTYDGTANAPDGQEGELYFDILIDALQYDDTDNDITNGTPHFNDIVNGFAKHQIYLLGDANITHTPTNNVTLNSTFPVDGTVTASFPVFIGEVRMIYKEKANTVFKYDTLVLNKLAPLSFNNTFNKTNKSVVYEYFLALTDNSSFQNISAFAPYRSSNKISLIQRNLPYYTIVNYNNHVKVDFETSLPDWKFGLVGESATSASKWIQAIPIGSSTNGQMVQTNKDHTTGAGKCAVTGNAVSANTSVGNADVDGGSTILMSPVYDFSGIEDPVISFWRWFSNSQGTNPRKDLFRVLMSSNNWASSIILDRTYQPDVSWRRYVTRLKDYGGSFNLKNVQFRFIAADSSVSGISGGSLVEAAVDDFEVYGSSLPNSITDLNVIDMVVVPNPADDKVKLYFGVHDDYAINILNLHGQIVRTVQALNTNYGEVRIADLQNGMYTVRVNSKNGFTAHKLLVQH
jgi:Zn-dependent metalloprotease